MFWTSTLQYRFSLVLGLMLTLQACGGGGGDDPTPPANVLNAVPTGYYNNTGTATVAGGTNNSQGSITDLQGMIHNNRLIMLSAIQGLSYDGTIAVTGNNYSGTVAVYDDGTLLASNVPISGAINQGSTVTGTLTGTGAGSGVFTLNYAANNSETAALSAVVRSTDWSAYIGGATFPFELFIRPTAGSTTTGTITENLAAGDGIFRACRMSGLIEPVSGTHLYTVSVTLSGCNPNTAADGTYTGLAATRTQNSSIPNDRLLFVITNGTFSPSSEFELL